MFVELSHPPVLTKDLARLLQDIVPVDASYEIKELYVSENKLDLATADAQTLPVVEITKVGYCIEMFVSVYFNSYGLQRAPERHHFFLSDFHTWGSINLGLFFLLTTCHCWD